jgi:hypothetical protein
MLHWQWKGLFLMDEHLDGQALRERIADTAFGEASSEYISRWNHLVSTTNWEKGRIILEWRQRLIDSGAPPQAYSDDAWSRLVGNVTGQHVGRLRRVWERFGGMHCQFPGLYWSHFHAALDWNDAEMWLEGAMQSGWSVAQMRAVRWEAIGAPADQKPREEDIIVAELDEDANPADENSPAQAREMTDIVRDPWDEEPAGDDRAEAVDAAPLSDPGPSGDASAAAALIRPFENLPQLPDDLHEAFDSFKLAILAHKMAGWQEISCADVLAVLDALKQLALAPSEAT